MQKQKDDKTLKPNVIKNIYIRPWKHFEDVTRTTPVKQAVCEKVRKMLTSIGEDHSR